MRSSAVHVDDGSKVAEARRAALDQARELEWSDVSSANAAIVVTELATNLAKHAREGLVSVTTLDGAQAPRLEILSVDQGPGIADLDASFRDGYSTAGSPGNGLGAVRRLAKSLDVISTRDKGTVFFAEMQDPERPHPSRPERFAIGGLCVQRAGESVAGDAWEVRHEGGSLAVLVCDGLGHGAIAAEASRQAVETFRERSALDPRETLERIHQALRSTRGAAAAIAVVDPDAGIVRYCGLGNISAAIVTPGDVRHLVSHNGTLGHIATRFVEFSYPWTAGASLVMHSDGVSARWQPDEWPGLWQRAPSMVAGVIYRDHRRTRDDSTVVVVRTL